MRSFAVFALTMIAAKRSLRRQAADESSQHGFQRKHSPTSRITGSGPHAGISTVDASGHEVRFQSRSSGLRFTLRDCSSKGLGRRSHATNPTQELCK